MKPYNERMTFREISHRIGISTTEVKHLYDEYSKDPLFMSRMSKFN
jgi:DNA-binding Lrp family transcriptional regulator